MTALEAPSPPELRAVQASGLSTAEAARRLAQFGANILGTRSSASAVREALSALANPLMLVLLVSDSCRRRPRFLGSSCWCLWRSSHAWSW